MRLKEGCRPMLLSLFLSYCSAGMCWLLTFQMSFLKCVSVDFLNNNNKQATTTASLNFCYSDWIGIKCFAVLLLCSELHPLPARCVPLLQCLIRAKNFFIHLVSLGIYPPGTFKRESKYGLTVLTSTDEGLTKYLDVTWRSNAEPSESNFRHWNKWNAWPLAISSYVWR